MRGVDIWLHPPKPHPDRILACSIPIGRVIHDRYSPHLWAHTLAEVREKGDSKARRSLREWPWFGGQPAKLIHCLSEDAEHLDFYFIPSNPGE